MQRGEGLLVDRLDGHRPDRLVAMGFEQALCVGAVGLVADDVGPGAMRRQDDDAVAEPFDLACPVVGRTVASIRTVAGGCWPKNGRKRSRARRWRSATLPGRRETAISKTDLARSTAIVICCTGLLLPRVGALG